jgi:hypothetical protein
MISQNLSAFFIDEQLAVDKSSVVSLISDAGVAKDNAL